MDVNALNPFLKTILLLAFAKSSKILWPVARLVPLEVVIINPEGEDASEPIVRTVPFVNLILTSRVTTTFALMVMVHPLQGEFGFVPGAQVALLLQLPEFVATNWPNAVFARVIKILIVRR